MPSIGAKQFLCEQLTHECIGDPKARLQQRKTEKVKKISKKKEKKASKSKGGGKRSMATDGEWVELGFGCCPNLAHAVDAAEGGELLFSGHLG